MHSRKLKVGSIRHVIPFTALPVIAAIMLLTSSTVLAGESKGGAKVPGAPAVQLGAPFRDNAVLQRGMKVPVWGWGEPGDTVTVEFAGQKQGGVAGEDGKWTVWLAPLKASFEPRSMEITLTTRYATQTTETIKNVLVGEVWLASGQSNMQWTGVKSSVNKLARAFAEEHKAKGISVFPIREFEITSVYSMLHPIEQATGSWKDGNYVEYSAIAFAFAHKLYEELNVPIGILNCSWSETPIQAWVPREGFRDGKDEYTRAIYNRVLETDPTTAEHKAAWSTFYKHVEAQIAENEALVKKGNDPKAIKPKLPGNMRGNRDATWLYHGRLHGVVPYAVQGAIWNQGYANHAEGIVYYNNLHSLIRGWRMAWDRPELPVYFHQFYSAGMRSIGQEDNTPQIGGMADMRLGTWMARDIPHTGMASQIDVSGGIHYYNKAVPGQRLALHALKNQYGQKDLVADGPMFKSYSVKGDQVTVEFDHAEGGLVVGGTAYNVSGKNEAGEPVEDATGFADPRVIENGAGRVKLFYLADASRTWYPASVKIDGSKVTLSSPKVKAPRGVSYAAAGVGFQPNLYNRALLPATPFIYFDHEMVTQSNWPAEKPQADGVEIDPATVGKLYEYRKMPLLSTQFRDNAVLQAGTPVTIWGSARHAWGHEADGEAVIHFSFARSASSGQGDIKKTIPVTPGMKEWQVTLPVMEAGTTPYTLKVSFTIDGELAHERVAEGIIFGDIWYVGAPAIGRKESFKVPEVEDSGEAVRVLQHHAKLTEQGHPSRFSVTVSTAPKNKYAARWEDASGVAAALGHQLAAKSGNPVGVIFMRSSDYGTTNPELKGWIAPMFLDKTPSLMNDYKIIGSQEPTNPYYLSNMRRYLADWKVYWGEYIPEMMATKAVPDGIPWGTYPTVLPTEKTRATHTYNRLVESFRPTPLKGVVFITSDVMVAGENARNFGPEMSVLANCLKATFGCGDIPFIYSMPTKAVAPSITAPKGIKGESVAIEVTDWKDATAVIDAAVKAAK